MGDEYTVNENQEKSQGRDKQTRLDHDRDKNPVGQREQTQPTEETPGRPLTGCQEGAHGVTARKNQPGRGVPAPGDTSESGECIGMGHE